jgi:hypothetical protein
MKLDRAQGLGLVNEFCEGYPDLFLIILMC